MAVAVTSITIALSKMLWLYQYYRRLTILLTRL